MEIVGCIPFESPGFNDVSLYQDDPRTSLPRGYWQTASETRQHPRGHPQRQAPQVSVGVRGGLGRGSCICGIHEE